MKNKPYFMKKPLTLLILVLAICLNSKATNYYIAASGNDANNGTSTSTPWKTLSKLNSFFSSLKAGDNVYLNRGDVFYGSISITKSGSSGSPITIFAGFTRLYGLLLRWRQEFQIMCGIWASF